MAVESLGTSTTATAASSDADVAQKKLADDLDQFMLLLTTQLQHQDPLDPMDANEFTSQLVQFASVEQQIQQNSNLEALIKAQEVSQMGSVASYIGKYVEAEHDYVELENSLAEFNYVLHEDAKSSQITILDESGKTVFSQSGETDAGKHGVIWEGMDQNDFQLSDGDYHVIVTALNADDEPIDVTTTVVGHVSGASYAGDEPTLFMGNTELSLAQIISMKAPITAPLTDETAAETTDDEATEETTTE